MRTAIKTAELRELRTTTKGPDDGAPKGIERWPDDGEPVVVVRPLDLPLALALTKTALAHQNEDALKQAVSGGPVRMVGYLKKQPDGRMVAVDEKGENPVPVGAGDILVSPSYLRKGD